MKKVLIIGNSAKEYALAKKMSETCKVYVAPGSQTMKDFAEIVDIRPNSSKEILEFVMENDISLTIPVDKTALDTNIVELFEKNNQQIFAPSRASISALAEKSSAKKLMYKLKIPTPKFGIFEKQSMVNDYIKNIKGPFVIKTNRSNSAVVLTSPKSAKVILDSLYAESPNKIIIEDYIFGTPFAFYCITDGYKALPVGSSILYKHSLEGEGGQLTEGMGACSPNYKLSFENECFLTERVIYPTIEYLEKQGTPYTGILGVNGILTEDNTIQVLGFQNFMQDADCAGIIELIEAELYDLFESCAMGTFSDEVSFIGQKDLSAVSIVLNCRNKDNEQNVISGIEDTDENCKLSFARNTRINKYLEYEAEYGSVAVVTAFGRTVASASERAYEEASNIKFRGVSYRKDICKPILSAI